MNLIPYILTLSLVLAPLQINSTTLEEVPEPPDTITTQELSIQGITERSTAILKLVDKYGKQYNVSTSTMLAVMKCENRDFDPTLQSYHVKNGVREDSWGLSQIHLPSHPNVSLEQATDPEFSVEFLAKHLSQGQGKMWTCYRQIYGVK